MPTGADDPNLELELILNAFGISLPAKLCLRAGLKHIKTEIEIFPRLNSIVITAGIPYRVRCFSEGLWHVYFLGYYHFTTAIRISLSEALVFCSDFLRLTV
ncbi:MAG: hypothetical protein HFI38_03415 [Lachnospiraceae bacterium]|jgi:hypothetical protein|nr:hypothetical protein [Lachnospiraceae bacterium]